MAVMPKTKKKYTHVLSREDRSKRAFLTLI